MDEIIIQGQTMTSLQIAEITGKQHAHVMEAIRSMEPAWQKVGQSNFRLATYTDKQGKERPCYQLTKTECLYIANGYVQSHTEPMKNSSQGRTFTYSQWTQKGRLFLYHELKHRNVLPLIEQ